MSKKHFISMANDLRRERAHWETQYGPESFQELIDFCVRFCREQNYRFDTDRFRGYVMGECGPSGGTVKVKAA